MNKNKLAIIILIIALLLMISGCKKFESVDSHKDFTMPPSPTSAITVAPTITLNIEPSITPTIAPTTVPNDKPIIMPTLTPLSSVTPMQTSDTEWIEAYYNYMKQSDVYAAGEVLLADLNFDNTPEILFCYYADGSYYYNKGLTYKDGQVIPFGNFYVSQLIGTIKDTQSQILWYGRYFPFSPHRGDNTSQTMCSFDFSDMSNIKENQLLEIVFYAPDSFIGNDNFDVKVSHQGENVPVTDAERSMYQTWYESDAEGGNDIYNLPHVAKLENGLNIQQQKTKVIDISDCYEKFSHEDTLNLDKFKQKLLQWYQ